MVKWTTFIEIIFQILFTFNRIPFVGNYEIYELFGTKWTHPREPASAPQTHHRRVYTSLIQTDAAELHQGRGCSLPFSVFLKPALCALAEQASWHTHCFELNTSKTQIGAALTCWRTLLSLPNSRDRGEPHLQLCPRVLLPADNIFRLRYSFKKK